ncbi:hypothetical protein LWI29_013050 [Acer saccharum]|uniref:Uncharacterized protein n=1 Tax=Acer saccharum TaxID=4024 RepID=A0AA39W6Z7_ACESA|nr:hypothetical protein LWI29_013050 [Acer saccharum]
METFMLHIGGFRALEGGFHAPEGSLRAPEGGLRAPYQRLSCSLMEAYVLPNGGFRVSHWLCFGAPCRRLWPRRESCRSSDSAPDGGGGGGGVSPVAGDSSGCFRASLADLSPFRWSAGDGLVGLFRSAKEQEVIDGDYGISNNPKNKRGEVHDYETGALNAKNMFATPSELRATPPSGWGGDYKAPDMSLKTLLLGLGVGGSDGSTNSEQEAVDGEYEIIENPENKHRELHNTVTGALNEMDEYATPNERDANTTPDMAMDTSLSSWPRWDSVDTSCPSTASSWGNKSS